MQTENEKCKRVLIITSSGGGGLLQTANAKEQEVLSSYPGVVVVKKDLLKDWVFRPIGRFFINFWNQAQKRGSIPAQKFCVYGQILADIFLHPIIFFSALKTLFREDIDRIIDTQPLGTSAILKAVRIYNWKRNKRVQLDKVLVDLPTKKATHFFRPIRILSQKNRELIQLTTIEPLLDEGETEEEFWKKTCNLPMNKINLEEVYVRQAFQKYKHKERSEKPFSLSLRYQTSEEIELMQKSFERGETEGKIEPGKVEFTIEPKDLMMTILLGSQPAAESTLKYVKKIVTIAKAFPKTKLYLFVFCADHVEDKEDLFYKVSTFVQRLKNYPKQLTIIPFSFQKEDIIAPLFFRSDVTCTRSGGQTAMELMCVSTGEIWIHSEAKKGEDPIRGIPGWEAASAIYLKKKRGATIVTPETIHSNIRKIYQTNSKQDPAISSLESSA